MTSFVRACLAVVVLGAMPAIAAAQTPTPGPPPPTTSSLWIAVGGGSTTLRGHCQFCEEETDYLHAGSVLADFGYRASRRADVGAEVLWTSATNAAGDRVKTTFLTAVAQFRPWASAGFFIRGGAGMALVRNWLINLDTPTVQKALAVHIGTGWAWRRESRIGAEFLAMQHAAALGDFATSDGPVENVLGNYWTIGAALVIR